MSYYKLQKIKELSELKQYALCFTIWVLISYARNLLVLVAFYSLDHSLNIFEVFFFLTKF